MTNNLTGDALKAEIERLRSMPCSTFPSDYEAGLWQIIDALLSENERQARVIERAKELLAGLIQAGEHPFDLWGESALADITAIESESKPQTEGD